MRTPTAVSLLHGLWQDSERHLAASVRRLTGLDQMRLSARWMQLTPARRTTELLASGVERIGSLSIVDADVVRRLSIGDRERLVVAIYAVTFSSVVDLVAICSAEGCGELMELTLSLPDLLKGKPVKANSPEHEMDLVTSESRWRVRFRLPIGADEEAAAALARSDPARAADHLLARCIVSVTDEADASVDLAGALAELRAPLAAAFHGLDPAADFGTEVSCPACGRRTRAGLSAQSLFESDLGRSARVFDDVDRIARVYHWSLNDILAMPISERRQFLARIEGASGRA